MDPFDPRRVRDAYDAVAEDYAAAFADDLADLPLDRELLETLTTEAPAGVLVDLGCGPAAVGGYLAAAGRAVVGVDMSFAMLGVAATRERRLAFVQGDLRRLPLRDESCAGAAAYYCVQHLPRSALASTLVEIRRVLTANGLLALAMHLGEGDVVTSEFLGHQIQPTGGALYAESELLEALTVAGFELTQNHHRQPLPHEHQTERIYFLARRS